MGFGSTASDSSALFGLAFAAPPLSVRLAGYGDSRTHYAKGKRSRFAAPPLSVRLAGYGDSRTHYAKGKRSRPEGRSHSLWTHDFRSVSLR